MTKQPTNNHDNNLIDIVPPTIKVTRHRTTSHVSYFRWYQQTCKLLNIVTPNM